MKGDDNDVWDTIAATHDHGLHHHLISVMTILSHCQNIFCPTENMFSSSRFASNIMGVNNFSSEGEFHETQPVLDSILQELGQFF